MKESLSVFQVAPEILQGMKKGILLTTKVNDKINTMTIGWGHLGIEWGKPIFIAYVRESRFTREMLDLHGEFTVNIPVGDVNTAVLRFCGCESGRDTDKISEMGLTLEEGECVQVPGIREFPLTLECKVIYKQKQDLHEVPKSILNRFYSEQDTGNYHIAYYGEILNAYKII